MLDRPAVLSLLSLLVLWLAARIGASSPRRRTLKDEERQDFGVVQAATLTLLGLIIGFSFSLAVSRYDQRKNYEEAEANAISTEYVRTALLPAADAAEVRALLRKYVDLRVLFYRTRNESKIRQINADTARLQAEMWSAVQAPAVARPTPVITLAVSGMNDVLNSQGYTQAAWWNRIPIAAWALMILIAMGSNFMIGFGAHSTRPNTLLILPLVVSTSFLLLADLDSPRGGLIQVAPHNLECVSRSLSGQ